jgi:hypothetical protein
LENNIPFIKGLELNKGFYFDIVKSLLDKKYPNLTYSATLLGYGSDVLDYDTEVSMDHNWGPRLQLFIDENGIIDELNEYLRYELPLKYRNFSINYTKPKYDGVQSMEFTDKKPINHLIEITTFEEYLENKYSINKVAGFTNQDWLEFTDQKLLEITSGLVFYDGLNKINNTRNELKFYPLDICKLRMAMLWNYIWNKEAFIGRSIEIKDYIGLKINVSRIVNYLIKILFYLEEKYIPYSKWFGYAFQNLKIYNEVKILIYSIFNENTPEKIEEYLCILYEKVIEEHNKNKELPYIENKVKKYFGRPYKVIFSETIVEELKNNIEDEKVKNIDIEKYGYDIILDV